MGNSISFQMLCAAFIVVACGPALVWAATGPSLDALPESAEERFAFYRDALAGDHGKIQRLETHAGDSSFHHWLLGAARVKLNQYDEAADNFLSALQLGDLGALLALAETHFQARNWVEAYAWTQIWVLEHYSNEEIQAGAAEGDPGMYLLRELLNRMNQRELGRAETLTEDYIQRWLPERPEPQPSCLLSEQKCGGWEPTHRQQPLYPRRMAQRRYQGWVRSIMLVDTNGDVADVEVLFASRDDFARPTRQALERWTFAPIKGREGRSSTLFTQTIEYRLTP